MADKIHFSVLGAFAVRMGDQDFALRGPKLRKLLSLLVLRANEIVGIDVVIDELWGDHPPASAVMTARTHVYHLRKWFTELPVERGCLPRIGSRPYGYLLEAPEECIDASVFRSLSSRGRESLAAGRVEEAAGQLRQALGLWRGSVLTDVRHGPVLGQLATELTGLREQALESRLETDMLRGRHREIVDELRALVAVQPLNEWLHGQLIGALHRSGRRAEALVAYQSLRTLLSRELGVEPSGIVRRLHGEILTGAA